MHVIYFTMKAVHITFHNSSYMGMDHIVTVSGCLYPMVYRIHYTTPLNMKFYPMWGKIDVVLWHARGWRNVAMSDLRLSVESLHFFPKAFEIRQK